MISALKAIALFLKKNKIGAHKDFGNNKKTKGTITIISGYVTEEGKAITVANSYNSIHKLKHNPALSETCSRSYN